MIIKDKEVIINPKLTYTKSSYSKKYAKNRVTIDKMIKAGELKTVVVNGTTLIII